MLARIRLRIACLAVALGMGVLSTPSSTRADMQMEITDGTHYQVVTDSANTGVLSFIGSVGGFTVNSETATSQPPIGLDPNAYAALDLASLNVGSSAAGTLTIILENTGYTGPTQLLAENGSFGGTIAGGTVSVSTWVSTSNAVPTLNGASPPRMSGVSGAVNGLSFTSSASAFSSAGSAGFVNTSGTFSLYQEIVISFTGSSGMFSGDLSNEVTPEPSSMALAGLGALGFVVYGLWRRKARGWGLRPTTPST
jgi:PEP-CTERM motif